MGDLWIRSCALRAARMQVALAAPFLGLSLLGFVVSLPLLDVEFGWFLVLMVSVVVAISVVYFVRGLRYLADPNRIPSLRRAAEWGDLQAVSEDVERQVEEPLQRHRRTMLTQDYFVLRTWSRFDVQRLEDLVWAYRHEDVQTVYFVPILRHHSLIVEFRAGTITFRAPEHVVIRFLHEMADTMPWVLLGFDEGLKRHLHRNREEVVAVVQERKWEQVASAAALAARGAALPEAAPQPRGGDLPPAAGGQGAERAVLPAQPRRGRRTADPDRSDSRSDDAPAHGAQRGLALLIAVVGAFALVLLMAAC